MGVVDRRDSSCQVDDGDSFFNTRDQQCVAGSNGGHIVIGEFLNRVAVWDDDGTDGPAASPSSTYRNRDDEAMVMVSTVSVASQCEQCTSDDSTQCNIIERPALERPNQALEQARARLALEKQQCAAVEKRAGDLELRVENLQDLCTSHANAAENYRRKVSNLETILSTYQKTMVDQAVETDEATVWCYSFQHQGTPVLRTFDKEVQTLRQVTVESLISPRIESQMLACANQRTV